MIHCAVTAVQHLRLGEIQIHPERMRIVKCLIIPEPGRTVAVFSAVTSKPDRRAGFQLTDDRILEFLNRKIQVTDLIAGDNISDVFDGIHLMIRLVFGRRIDQNRIFIQIFAKILLIEFQRCYILDRMMFFLCVTVFKGKAHRRHAEAVRYQAVALFERCLPQLFNLIRRTGFAYIQRKAAQTLVQQTVHACSM